MANNKLLALFDIDGTLADISHRRYLVECSEPNWKQFFALMGDDKPNEPIVSLYRTIWASTNYECVLVSGRPEKYRELTEQWLFWNDIPFTKLIMRPNNDNRPDSVVKEQVLKSLLADNKQIAFVVDDRKSVVDMWRSNGVICLQCDDYDQ